MRFLGTAGFVLLIAASCDSGAHLYDTTRLGNTFDRLGPYTVRTVAGGTSAPSDVILHYQGYPRVREPLEVKMSEVSDGIYEAEIPGHPPFTQISYYVELRDGDESVTDPKEALSGTRFGFWVLGSPCGDTIDCDPGERCDNLSTNAECTEPGDDCVCRALEGGCKTDTDCGKGFACSADGRCELVRRECDSCATSEVCDPVSAVCIPRPRCDGGLSCPLDFLCEIATFLCRRICTKHSDCNAGENCRYGICRTS